MAIPKNVFFYKRQVSSLRNPEDEGLKAIRLSLSKAEARKVVSPGLEAVQLAVEIRVPVMTNKTESGLEILVNEGDADKAENYLRGKGLRREKEQQGRKV